MMIHYFNGLSLNSAPAQLFNVIEIHEHEAFGAALSYSETYPEWLVVSFCLFFIGLAGMVFNYKNFLVTMMCIEIMYLGAVTSFVLYGTIVHDIVAQAYGLLVLIFAACESAVGLGLLVSVYRYGRTIGFNTLTTLGG